MNAQISGPQPLIRLVELTKVYGTGEVQVKALDGVSLEIAENEFVAIMGHLARGRAP